MANFGHDRTRVPSARIEKVRDALLRNRIARLIKGITLRETRSCDGSRALFRAERRLRRRVEVP